MQPLLRIHFHIPVSIYKILIYRRLGETLVFFSKTSVIETLWLSSNITLHSYYKERKGGFDAKSSTRFIDISGTVELL